MSQQWKRCGREKSNCGAAESARPKWRGRRISCARYNADENIFEYCKKADPRILTLIFGGRHQTIRRNHEYYLIFTRPKGTTLERGKISYAREKTRSVTMLGLWRGIIGSGRAEIRKGCAVTAEGEKEFDVDNA